MDAIDISVVAFKYLCLEPQPQALTYSAIKTLKQKAIISNKYYNNRKERETWRKLF